MITSATVAQLRALWTDLAPVIQKDLDAISRELESADDWPTVRALQASAATLRGFLKFPDNIARRLELGLDGTHRETPPTTAELIGATYAR